MDYFTCFIDTFHLYQRFSNQWLKLRIRLVSYAINDCLRAWITFILWLIAFLIIMIFSLSHTYISKVVALPQIVQHVQHVLICSICLDISRSYGRLAFTCVGVQLKHLYGVSVMYAFIYKLLLNWVVLHMFSKIMYAN